MCKSLTRPNVCLAPPNDPGPRSGRIGSVLGTSQLQTHRPDRQRWQWVRLSREARDSHSTRHRQGIPAASELASGLENSIEDTGQPRIKGARSNAGGAMPLVKGNRRTSIRDHTATAAPTFSTVVGTVAIGVREWNPPITAAFTAIHPTNRERECNVHYATSVVPLQQLRVGLQPPRKARQPAKVLP